jgi:cyclopropane fatty-acyl-phospholipid synthase-like methyltransferase
MILSNRLLGFRYRKNFFLNRINRRKYKSDIKIGSHNSCPVCGFEEASLISEVDRTGFPCQTVICKQCQFVFNNSFIADPEDFYSHEWGEERWKDPEKNFQKRTATDSYAWKRMAYLAKNINNDFKKINNILEVGCGDGCNLLPYHLIGKNVVGCDFNDNFLKPGREHGLKLITGGIENISESSPYDLVMLIHSFEHVTKMDEVVRLVANRIVSGGLVFVEVPGIIGWNRPKNNTKHSMGLKSSNNFLGYLQFQHNYHFDLNHLKVVWERNGFEMVSGDEWVRAIFRKKKNFENTNFNNELLNSKNDIFLHLSNVERDFLSIRNLACGLNKLISRKICTYNKK